MESFLSLKLYKDNNEVFNIDKVKYLKEKKTISFKYDNILYKLDEEVFARENNEFIFKLNIIKKECIYTLKETNTTLSINVLESSIKKLDNTIEIIYKLETEEEINKIVINFYRK